MLDDPHDDVGARFPELGKHQDFDDDHYRGAWIIPACVAGAIMWYFIIKGVMWYFS